MKIAFHPDTGVERLRGFEFKKFESRRDPCAFRIRRAWGKGVEEAEPSREEARVDSARSRAEYRINSPCRDDKRTLPTPIEDIWGGDETTLGSDSRATVHDRVVVPRKFEQTRMDPSKAFRQICDRPGERGDLPFFLDRNVLYRRREPGGVSFPLLHESVQSEWKVTI